MTKLRRSSVKLVLAALSVVVLGACAPSPAPLPDPVISCMSFGGDVTYTPPASPLGLDVVVTAQPGAGMAGCTDNTGNGITGGSITAAIYLPGFACGPHAPGTVWGSGVGTIQWSNGWLSSWTADVYADNSVNPMVLRMRISGGVWTGATADVSLHATASDGNCVDTPVSSATLAGTAVYPWAFILRP
jgi:hypothetical protein